MQNEVRDDATAIIKMGWIQRCKSLPIEKQAAEDLQRRELLPEIPEHIVKVVGAIDPAEKTKEHNDFTGKSVHLVSNLGNRYFVYLGNDKLTTDQNKKDVMAIHERYKLSICYFETNQAYSLFKEIQRVSDVPLKEMVTSKDKLQRLTSVSPQFENGKVYFHESIPEALFNEAVDQLTTNAPPHDDLRDAIVLGIEEAVVGKKAAVFGI